MTRRDEAEYLFERSKQFLETAKFQIKKGFFSLAVFSLEQALQLSLKSKMLASGVDYPRTHSVRTLLEMLLELAPEEERATVKQILDSYLLELGMLEDAYITSRYVRREFRKEEADVLMRVVKEVMKNVT